MKTPNSGLERDGRGKPSPNGDSAVDPQTIRADLARDLDTMANVSIPDTLDQSLPTALEEGEVSSGKKKKMTTALPMPEARGTQQYKIASGDLPPGLDPIVDEEEPEKDETPHGNKEGYVKRSQLEEVQSQLRALQRLVMDITLKET